MRDHVEIKSGTFEAHFFLTALERFRLSKLKKLFQLTASDPWGNAQAIEAIRLYISDAIPAAQEEMRAAARAYEGGWRKVDKPRSRKPDVVKQLKINEELTTAFKKAKARYERLLKIRTLYDETIGDTKH